MERSDEPAPSSDATSAPASPRAFQIVATVLLLVLGVQLWLIVGTGDYGLSKQRYLLLAALVVALIPPINRAFYFLLDKGQVLSLPKVVHRLYTGLPTGWGQMSTSCPEARPPARLGS